MGGDHWFLLQLGARLPHASFYIDIAKVKRLAPREAGRTQRGAILGYRALRHEQSARNFSV
jgi:hypothetical protein